MDMTTVSFPGLGIEEFTMNRAAFSVFGKEIYWYAIFIVLGMIGAFVHAYLRCKREGVKPDDILDAGLWSVFASIPCARLFYVIFDFIEHPERYETLMDVIAIWDGGLAIYGGVIGGVIAILIVCRIKKQNPLRMLDIVSPGVMLAQTMGRWGNFVNGEAHGGVVAEGSPLYFLRMGLYDKVDGVYGFYYFHPTFLYESLWNLVGFVLITIFYRKKKFNGQILLSYFAWYGFGRMFIEGMRTDSLWVVPGVIRVSQLLGGIFFVVGTGLIIAGLVLTRKGKLQGLLKVTWVDPTLVAATANGAPVENPDADADIEPEVESDVESDAEPTEAEPTTDTPDTPKEE